MSLSFLEEKPCLLCGCEAFNLLYSYPPEHYPHALYETASWDGREPVPLSIVRCADCNFVYSRPSFKEEYLDLVYPADLIERTPSEERLERLFDRDNPKFNRLLTQLGEYLDEGAVLVDIGSRYGAFPYIARERYGYRAYGVEYNAASVDLGRRRFEHLFQGMITTLPGVLETAGIEDVDAFVLDDLLEHLVDPARDIGVLASLQRPGGYLFLRQMDFQSLGRRLFGRRWYYFQPAAHMAYFDEGSAHRLLDRQGYDVAGVSRTPLALNLLRTFAQSLPSQLVKLMWQRLRRRPGKRSYLTERLKSVDDMFLIVARKR